MSPRMKNALKLADKCWAKAYKTNPEFVEAYLTVAEKVLKKRQLVTGDVFRQACKDAGVHRPAKLHPNVWVSGVRVLHTLGWTIRGGQTIPTASHNHMDSVTVWKSAIFVAA